MNRFIKNLAKCGLALLLCLCLLGAACAEGSFALAGSAYGVSAEEEIGMGAALATLAENAAAEGAEPNVLGMDEMLAGAEYEALLALTPAERMFAALKLLGHDDEVDAAVQALGIELSEDANALYDALAARLLSMPEEDWTAFEGLLETYFPTFVEGEQSFMQMTLQCPGGEPALLRMTFVQNAEGAWLLSQIDVAAA